MSDMSISPSKAQARGAGPSPLPSPLRGQSFSRSTHESHNESYSGLITAEVGLSRNSESPDVEKMIARRTSQSCHRDYDSIRKSLPHSKRDPVASIVLGAKMLPMSTPQIKQGHSFQFWAETINARGYLVPASPSFSGLPEELILEIVFYLDIFDILALRKTNRRLLFISRARIIWLNHLSSLLRQIKLQKHSATFLDSLLSTSTLEHIVKRPHAFVHKWFIAHQNPQNPSTSKALSAIWSTPPNFRLPILLPGGRWLVAVCYTYDEFYQKPNNVCLWDLEHGRTKDLPEAQMEAQGVVLSMDVKMDFSGALAMMSILTAKVNLTGTVVYWVDVYQIKILPSTFGFFHLDRMALNERRAHEIRIFPQSGVVLVDLFDRVLIWEYAPGNKCVWFITSKIRHQFQRFTHRAAHDITLTRKFLLVADGDESSLRGYIIPTLLNRPKQLSTMALYLVDPVFEHPLPCFATSLSFSTTRLVDMWRIFKFRTSRLRQKALNIRKSIVSASGPSHSFDRGVLFIDAAACDSYIFCFYPLQEISQEAGTPNALSWTSMSRDSAREQIWAGVPANGTAADGAMRTSMSRPFNVSPLAFGCHISGARGSGDLLWTGLVDEISPSLFARASQPKACPRTVILMRNPENPEGLVIISTLGPPRVDSEDLAEGQSVISEVEQGRAKTVLHPINRTCLTEPQAKIIGATVDSISGRVCIVVTNPHREHATALRLLEYS